MPSNDFSGEVQSEKPARYILSSDYDTRGDFLIPGVDTLPQLLSRQAARLKDGILFSFQPQQQSDLLSLSYTQAYTRACSLAQPLRHRLVSSNSKQPIVGVWLERSIDLHLAILSTTISGAAWLPFDADAPKDRVTACLKDSDARILLCDAAHREDAHLATRDLECQVLTFEELSNEINNTPQMYENTLNPQPDDIAYMIYTSGSSGTPKGIAISHKAAVTFCLSERTVLNTGPKDIVWQGFSAAFDMFIEETWVSIAGGAHIVIGNRAEIQNVSGLGGVAGVWAKRGVTLVNAVPTLINIMTSLDDDSHLPSSVRLINLGGEACPSALVDRLWTPNLRIINTYGPSETTVTATFKELFPKTKVTIGKPLPKYEALLLPISDETPRTWQPLELAEGVEGELAIGGPCLGEGYIGRPELTAEKYVKHPLSSHEGQRLYRTGDRIRLDSNLDIVFLGRIDAQVKHRGFRIELGEIEHAIAAHPEIQTAAVILSAASDQLEAYIISKDDKKIKTEAIRSSLNGLPSYMHPESYFFLTVREMPRLPSGKINLKSLQLVSAEKYAESHEDRERQRMERSASIVDDGSDMSVFLKAMTEIFSQATNISPKADFFSDLGCHSMLAASLVSKVRRESPPESIFKRLGLQHIYTHRSAHKIISSLGGSLLNEKGSLGSGGSVRKSNVQVGDHWPVDKSRYVLCSLAQLPALVLLFFIEGLTLLAPYIVFYTVLRTEDIGSAIVTTYFTFVMIPIIRAAVAILGKWLILGKAKAGEYPLYGQYYYRWWLAGHLVKFIDAVRITDTPMLSAIMRCLGADIGSGCHVGTAILSAEMDLLHIGDHVCIGKETGLVTSWVERGRLILANVTIESQAYIGSRSVVEGGAVVEQGAELGSLSMLPQGKRIPEGEKWIGSPATFDHDVTDIGAMKANSPSWIRVACMTTAMILSTNFILPIFYFGPQIPSMLLFDYVDFGDMNGWAQTAIVVVPAAFIYPLVVYLELLILRWGILGSVKECSYTTTSIYYYRKWLINRVMDMNLVILQPVYATLYVVPFLRSLGVKMGHRAEVSTARGINFELTVIGDECFVADAVAFEAETIRNNIVTQKTTVMQDRAFVGNAALVPDGSRLASNTLVGVLSCAPDESLKPGESCFGTPPVLMPARGKAKEDHADHLLFRPRRTQIALRLLIEGFRILLPQLVTIYALGFGLLVVENLYQYVDVVAIIFLIPLIYFFFFSVSSLVIVLFFKWVFVGHYHHAEWPLWSINVWKSEFVTSIYETLMTRFFFDLLTGTPYLAMCLRLFGVQVGSYVTLLSHDFTEFDMVSVGDEAVMNMGGGPQTHLFEDRVMKIGRVDMETRSCSKPYAICLPDSRIAEGGQLGCLSLLMKGETVPAHEAWEGAPIAPRQA